MFKTAERAREGNHADHHAKAKGALNFDIDTEAGGEARGEAGGEGGGAHKRAGTHEWRTVKLAGIKSHG